MVDIFKAISRNAKRFPGSLAFIGPNATLTYPGLAQSIDNIAAKALAQDVEPGSTVYVHCRDRNYALLLKLGLMRAGMTVSLATNPSIYLDHGIVFDLAISDGSASTGSQVAAKRVVRLTEDWTRPNSHPKRSPKDASFGLLVASSGSTGRSKLLYATQQNIEYRLKLTDHEPAYNSGPIRSLSLLEENSVVSFTDVLTTLVRGGQVVRLEPMQIPQALDAICVYEPTYVCTAPFLLVRKLEALKECPRRFRKIDFLRISGAYCAPEVRQQAKELLADNVITSYGSTETGRIACGEFEEISAVDRAVGKVLPNISVEAFGESGNPLPRGEVGELRIKLPAASPMQYLDKNGKTSPLKDGWYYPDDIGRVDENGYLIVTGRKSNVINFGGNKLDPERLEAILLTMPEIEDVAVAPMPGTRGFDAIAALVKSSKQIDVEKINSYLLEKREAFQLETIRLVSSLPRGSNGKISRRDVAETLKRG